MGSMGDDVGQYLDPAIVDPAVGYSIPDWRPSWGMGVMSLRKRGTEVPLSDGRIAIINDEGVIIDVIGE